jgi:hypothetical protein
MKTHDSKKKLGGVCNGLTAIIARLCATRSMQLQKTVANHHGWLLAPSARSEGGNQRLGAWDQGSQLLLR